MFDHLRLKNICHLVSVLSQTNPEMRSLIRDRYEYQGTHYDETFAFLKSISGIKETNAVIQVHTVFKDLAENIDEKEIAGKTLQLLQEKKSPHRDQLFQYILKFGLNDGVLTYQPGDVDRSEFSDVRNFLIEAGVVEYQSIADRYLIVPNHIHLYAFAQESTKVVTPNVLKRRLADTDEIGREAELAMMKYEKNRVGKPFEHHVAHVALKNEAAGYDIKSVSVLPGDQLEPRYIEVKAVPLDTYRFFWTGNERRVAELLKAHYFLYLLPVNRDKIFSLNNLKIIQDPISGILDSPDAWNVETDLVRCSLK
jgi:hypothetical protein